MVRLFPGALFKTIVREIRDSFGRYLAIIGIIALGSGLFTGLKVTKTAMIETCRQYLDRTGFYDYRLISTVGWEESNVIHLREIPWVSQAAGACSVDFTAVIGGHEMVLKALSLTEGINEPELLSGRMPERADECVVDSYSLGKLDLGSVITVAEDEGNAGIDLLRFRSYTVVGSVRSPLFINYERGTTSVGSGSVSAFLYLMPEGFDADYYTEIYLRLTETAPIYSAEYDAILSRAEGSLSIWSEREARERYDRLMNEARKELQEAQEKLEDGESQYQDGLHAYWDGRKTYLDGREQYDKGAAELERQRHDTELQLRHAYYELLRSEDALLKGRESLDAGWKELRDSLPDLKEIAFAALQESTRMVKEADTLTEEHQKELLELISQTHDEIETLDLSLRPEMYTDTLFMLDEAQRTLTENREEMTDEQYEQLLELLRDMRSRFSETFGPLYDGYMALLAGERELEEGRKKLDDGWAEWLAGGDAARLGFQQAEDQLEIARLRLVDGKQQLEDAQKQLADSRSQLEDGRRQLREAQATLDETKSPQTFVLDRKTNIGYVCFESDTDIVAAIANVFPFFFFAVAALVCITTISRMVDDERGQIGVMKALGYGEFSIMSRYLIYSGSASLFGCLLGVFGGSWLFPVVIWKAYGIMYSMPSITVVFDLKLMSLSSVSYLALAILVTWFGCRHELKEPAAELIRPKSPPAGKRIFLERIGFVWKRLSFLRKVSLRNVFRYSKRLIMMILGIGGCTALLLTGLGLNDSITHIADRQFDTISLYDASINFGEDMSGPDGNAFLDKFKDDFSKCVFLYSCNAECSTELHNGSVSLIAANDLTDLEGLMSFHDERGELDIPGEGECFISKNLADRYGLGAGNEITLTIGESDSVTMTVSGVFSNVIYNYVYTDIKTMENGIGEHCALKLGYVNFAPEKEHHEAAAALMGDTRVANVSVTTDMRERVNSMLDSMTYVVFLVILCAGALAFIVLFNLTNINIQERIREIATLKVLGFTREETAQYVFRENMILTLCGSAAGIPMGIWLHTFVMAQVKIDMISFEANRSFLSYVLSILITFAFTLLVNLFMLPRLDRINMTEALKSVE